VNWDSLTKLPGYAPDYGSARAPNELKGAIVDVHLLVKSLILNYIEI